MIEAVILYSSNDSKYFQHCVGNLLKLNIPCHVITYTHMWKGTPENMEVYKKSNEMFKDNPLYKQYLIEWTEGQNPWHWEYIGRKLGIDNVTSEYTLLIDIDEIVDIEKTQKWIESGWFKQYNTMKLTCNIYWREPKFLSDKPQWNAIMVKSELAKQVPYCFGGRNPYYNRISNSACWPLTVEDAFIDHYTFTRDKEEMTMKVKNWGHADDRNDWDELIEQEFSREFTENDKDFNDKIHGSNWVSTYTLVQPKYNFNTI